MLSVTATDRTGKNPTDLQLRPGYGGLSRKLSTTNVLPVVSGYRLQHVECGVL